MKTKPHTASPVRETLKTTVNPTLKATGKPAPELPPQAKPQPQRQVVPERQAVPQLKRKALAVAGLAASTLAVGLMLPGVMSRTSDHLTEAQALERQMDFTAALPLRLSPIRLSGTDSKAHLPERAKVLEALGALALPPAEASLLHYELARGAVHLVRLQVFDDVEEDGDVVEITAGGFSQTLGIFHTPQAMVVPVSADTTAIAVTGIQDGGGGITVALTIDGKSLPLPRLSPQQTITLPVDISGVRR